MIRAKKSKPDYTDRLDGLMVVCLIAILLILAFSYAAPRAPIGSSETTFTANTPSGLVLIPASCASAVTYTHGTLSASADAGGFVLGPSVSEYGAYSTPAAMYVCATNSSGNTYFIPAMTAAELQAFKAAPPSGVTAW